MIRQHYRITQGENITRPQERIFSRRRGECEHRATRLSTRYLCMERSRTRSPSQSRSLFVFVCGSFAPLVLVVGDKPIHPGRLCHLITRPTSIYTRHWYTVLHRCCAGFTSFFFPPLFLIFCCWYLVSFFFFFFLLHFCFPAYCCGSY